MGAFSKISFTMSERFLFCIVLLSAGLTLVSGECCGSCDGSCPCAGQPGGCDGTDDSTSCSTLNYSHLCCAPKAAGDCNLFCCECSSCCKSANGVSSTISAAEKWRTLDKNNDKKLDEAELSLFLGNGTSTWTKYTLHHKQMTRLFMNAVDSNHNGQVDPWEMDSELKHMSKDKEL